MAAVSRVSCCSTVTWQPATSDTSAERRRKVLPSNTTRFSGTKVGAIGRVSITQPRNAGFPLQLFSKEAPHHAGAQAVRCAAQVAAHDRTAGQLAECAPEEQGEAPNSSPLVNLFGTAFVSRGAGQVDNAVSLVFKSYQEPLVGAPPAGARMPVGASCHILSEGIMEDQILRAHIDALSEEQAILENSFQAPHDGPLLLPDTLDWRLSSLSPVDRVDETALENTPQTIQNMFKGAARLLGALVLAFAFALCTPHPALAARSMGRAGGGGFSSSRSSGGSSHSSSSHSHRSRSSRSRRSGLRVRIRVPLPVAAALLLAYILAEVLGVLLEADRARADYDYLYKYSFSPSTRSAVCAQGQLKRPLRSPGPSHYRLQARPQSTDGPGSPESEEPQLNSHSRSDTSTSTLVQSGDSTWPSSRAVFQDSDTDDLLLRAYFRSLSGDTWQQQEAGTESPSLEEEAADAEARNASLPGGFTIFGSIALGSLVITRLVSWAEKVDRSDEYSVRETDGSAGADASRALERTRVDVSEIRALNGARLYDYNADAKNCTTVVKIQVALLGQAKSVQAQMDKLCEEAETSSSQGLHNLLTETLSIILRHSTFWAFGTAQMDAVGYDAAERRYQQVVLEERSKAKQETLVNRAGKLTKTPSIRSSDDDPPLNEFIVVTVLAAVKGRLESRDRTAHVASREKVRGAVEALSLVQPNDLEVLDILWVPQEDDDTLTHAELIEHFPELSPM